MQSQPPADVLGQAFAGQPVPLLAWVAGGVPQYEKRAMARALAIAANAPPYILA